LSFFITGLGPGVYFNVIFILVWDLVYILRWHNQFGTW
jgi:hypothetical protein